MASDAVVAVLNAAFMELDGDEERTAVLATGVLEMFDALQIVSSDVEDLVTNEPAAVDTESATKALAVVEALIVSCRVSIGDS